MAERGAVRGRGLSLRTVIVLMFLVGIAVSGLVLAATYQTTSGYADTERATEELLNCQSDIYTIEDRITSLNDRSRNYVVNGGDEELVRYCNEYQVQQVLDAPLVGLRSAMADVRFNKHLDAVLDLSEQMSRMQRYAMRLAAEGYGRDLSNYPPVIQQTALTAEDRALSREAQTAKASVSLYSPDYMVLKNQLEVRLGLCKDILNQTMTARLNEYSDRLERMFNWQRRLIFGMIATLLMVLIYVLAAVIYPMHRLVHEIRAGNFAGERGSSEIRFLAETYNAMHRHMAEANTRLSYEAAHDPLTGLYNRSAFDALRNETAGQSIALLIIDIDLFKHINDAYGHAMGDKVLIRVARVLRDSFREADKVCRIGGDEFSVIMVGGTSAIAPVIRRKVTAAAEILAAPDGDIPAVTISVGCAFSNQMKPGDDLFKKADQALYAVKQRGRNDCGFYEPEAQGGMRGG